MKKYIVLFCFYLALILFCLVSASRCGRLSAENRRLTSNQNAFLERDTYYRTKDSLSAASVERLTLSYSELMRHNVELVENAEHLNIKIRRIESANRTATETIYQLETQWRDSLVHIAGRTDTIAMLIARVRTDMARIDSVFRRVRISAKKMIDNNQTIQVILTNCNTRENVNAHPAEIAGVQKKTR